MDWEREGVLKKESAQHLPLVLSSMELQLLAELQLPVAWEPPMDLQQSLALGRFT